VVEHKDRTGLWGALSRWAAPESDIDAQNLRERSRVSGCRPIEEIPDRAQCKVRGTLQTVTLQPRASIPALEADLFDGSGTVTLVWLGRRRITGVACGRRLIAKGRLSTIDGRRVMFNPRYELLPAGIQ
jgi:hypothetical protein